MPTLKAFARLDASTSSKVGLDEVPHIALFLQDADRRITAVDSDIDYGEMYLDAPAHVMTDFVLPDGRFALQRDGWPEDWDKDAVVAPSASDWFERRAPE